MNGHPVINISRSTNPRDRNFILIPQVHAVRTLMQLACAGGVTVRVNACETVMEWRSIARSDLQTGGSGTQLYVAKPLLVWTSHAQGLAIFVRCCIPVTWGWQFMDGPGNRKMILKLEVWYSDRMQEVVQRRLAA